MTDDERLAAIRERFKPPRGYPREWVMIAPDNWIRPAYLDACDEIAWLVALIERWKPVIEAISQLRLFAETIVTTPEEKRDEALWERLATLLDEMTIVTDTLIWGPEVAATLEKGWRKLVGRGGAEVGGA